MSSLKNIHKIISYFSSFTVLPISPDDVKDQIISYGVKDEISLIGVDINKEIFLGAFYQYVRPSGVYGEQIICSDIYYANSLTRGWKRLVVCKELLHLLDQKISKVSSRTHCENLLDHIGNLDVKSPLSDKSVLAWGDVLMTFNAVAVLFPWDARNILLPSYNTGTIKLDEISRIADLPHEVVSLVMSDIWPNIYKIISGGN